jgi:CubicO group peptidase (beta-lactamase class C family)
MESAGGLYSTVKDMARFLSFEANPDSVAGLLSAESVAESWTKATTPANSPIGLGWVVDDDSEVGTVIWHNGATQAYGAWVGMDPKTANGAIVFVSTGDLTAPGPCRRRAAARS